MATIQKRQGNYRVMVRRKGFPTQYATFTRLTDAKRWAQQVEGDITRGRHITHNKAKKRNVAALVDRRLEMVRLKKPHAYPKQKQILDWWRDQLGAYSLAHLTPAVISEKRDLLLAENIGSKENPRHRSSPTANRYLAALSKACQVAVKEWHWLQDNPVLRVRREAERPWIVRWLSEDERSTLLAACDNSPLRELTLIVMLALTTGMRRSEIRGLRWPDIDIQRGSIILHKTKNKERRAVPIVPQTLALLGKHAQIRRLDTDLVFPQPSKAKAIDFDHAFIDAVRDAKIENFRFHDLRHTAASYLAMSGATTAEIAAVLGHKTLAMVKRYAHLGDQHTTKVVERMTEKYFE